MEGPWCWLLTAGHCRVSLLVVVFSSWLLGVSCGSWCWGLSVSVVTRLFHCWCQALYLPFNSIQKSAMLKSKIYVLLAKKKLGFRKNCLYLSQSASDQRIKAWKGNNNPILYFTTFL